MPEFVFEINEEQYEKAGSKFITTDPPVAELTEKNKGDTYLAPIEVTDYDWDTPGKSLKIMTVITSGVDEGHAEKISFGVDEKGVWKGKTLFKALTGKDMPMVKGKDGKNHPASKTEDLVGKKGIGRWVVVEGAKGGDPKQGNIWYPKLQDIFPTNYKPNDKEKSKDLGF